MFDDEVAQLFLFYDPVDRGFCFLNVFFEPIIKNTYKFINSVLQTVFES